MRQLITFAFVFASLAGGVSTAALPQESDLLAPLEQVEVREVDSGVSLQNIQDYLNGVKTLKADFQQIAPDGAVSTGVFRLERPGKVRFEYNGDNPILIVSDGNLVNFIDYELGQITRWPVDETPLALLLEKQITFGENVILTGTGPGSIAGYTMVSAHDPEKPEQGTLTLFFTGKGGAGEIAPLMLDGWEVVDAQGSLTTVRLSNLQENVPLDSSSWQFDDPRNERFERRRRR